MKKFVVSKYTFTVVVVDSETLSMFDKWLNIDQTGYVGPRSVLIRIGYGSDTDIKLFHERLREANLPIFGLNLSNKFKCFLHLPMFVDGPMGTRDMVLHQMTTIQQVLMVTSWFSVNTYPSRTRESQSWIREYSKLVCLIWRFVSRQPSIEVHFEGIPFGFIASSSLSLNETIQWLN